MRFLYLTTAGIAVAVGFSWSVDTALAQGGLDLKLECKRTIEFVIPWKKTTITMEGPIAVATGGTPPYSVSPDPDLPITVTGYPEGISTTVYEVVDDAGNSALCQPSLLMLDGSKPLSIVCQADLIVYAAPDELMSAILYAPIAIAEGGDFSYDFEPDPSMDISIVGEPGFFVDVTYNVTDGQGNFDECTVRVSIAEEVSIVCKDDLIVYVGPGELATATLDAPIAFAEGGDFSYDYEPDPNTAISISGNPGVSENYTYTVTDGVGGSDQCMVTLSIGEDACGSGDSLCDDPHMQGLRGQKIDWSGINGGWYSLVKDNSAELGVNVRLTAPLPEEFPDRQLVTGFSILYGEHSLIIEVENPYDTATDGCPHGISPCLANGGLRVTVDGEQHHDVFTSSRDEEVADGIRVSASNLPVECRQFGGDKIWAQMYDEMLHGKRRLEIYEMQHGNHQLDTYECFESWILRFDQMAASDWCAQYIAHADLVDVQSIHAIFKIVTPAVTVRLNAGVNYQGGGELDWDGRVLPDLTFWQMDVGLHGLSVENESLSGILGETARPVLDKDGHEVMEGRDAFRGTVQDYRVCGPLGTDFALLHNKGVHEE